MPDDDTTWTITATRAYYSAVIDGINRHFEARINHLEERFVLVAQEKDEKGVERAKHTAEMVSKLQELLQERLTSIDKASIILAGDVTRVPTLLDREIDRLTSLMDEKFVSVQRQFADVTLRSAASEDAAKTGVAAALQAQKEAAAAQNSSNAAAITKSETNTTKQIDSIVTLIASNAAALNEKVDSITQRINRYEGQETGTTSRNASNITFIMATVAIIGVLVTIGGLMLNFTSQKSASVQPSQLAPR